MKALHFMKIDYMLTRKNMYIVPLFFVLALIVGTGVGGGEASLLIACSYMVFVSSVFSTAPFGYCAGKNRGFLLLLPATVKDRVAGRFLYGLSFVALLGLMCGVFMGVYKLMGYAVTRWMLAVALCELAVSVVIMALEFLFFYLFGEGKGNWQYPSNIVRVAPGMAVFFAMSYLVDELGDASDMGASLEMVSAKLIQAGVLAVAVSLLLTVAVGAACVKVIERRDYA